MISARNTSKAVQGLGHQLGPHQAVDGADAQGGEERLGQVLGRV